MSKSNSLLKQAELFEKLALYGDRRSFLKSLAQDPNAWTQEQVEQWDPSQRKDLLGRPLHEGIPPVQPEQPAASVQMPAAHITGYTPVDKGSQQLLSKFLVDHNVGIPLSKIDGRKGPETMQALKNFKSYLRQPGMSDQEVFSLLKMPEQINKMVASMKAQPIAPGLQNALNRPQTIPAALQAAPPAPAPTPQQVATNK